MHEIVGHGCVLGSSLFNVLFAVCAMARCASVTNWHLYMICTKSVCGQRYQSDPCGAVRQTSYRRRRRTAVASAAAQRRTRIGLAGRRISA